MKTYKEIQLSNGGTSWVDESDYEFINQWKWHRSKNGYAVRNSSNKHLSIHQQVLGEREGFEIDHRDRNKLNNTRGNLRFVTRSQNNSNRPTDPRSKTGHNGINILANGMYRVRFSNKELGRCKTLGEAIEVRKRYESALF